MQLPDGTYTNLLNDQPVVVNDGRMAIPQSAAIVRCAAVKNPVPLQSDFYEFRLPAE